MSVALVLIHGRGQESRDPTDLERKWLAGLAAGLVRAGLPPLNGTRVTFPYYGNLLYRLTAELAASGKSIHLERLPGNDGGPGPVHPHLTDEVDRLVGDLLGDMAEAAGAPFIPSGQRFIPEGLDDVLRWRRARQALSWVARHTRLDREIIEGQLQDVAVYLKHGREQVLALVREQIPPADPIVLVSHSLGTVVARDLLDDDDVRSRTLLWVTAGSPLGLKTIQRNLRSEGARNPGVDWLTTYDVNDVVALGHPLLQDWGRPLLDVEVENQDSPHSIERYLGHGEVAGPIGRAIASVQ
jgi:hypothetical protein